MPSLKEKPIGIVGLGRMGANMGRRLRDCGYRIASVHDICEDVARKFAEEIGSQAASSLADLSANAAIVVTVVSDDQAMEAIYAGESGLFAHAEGKTYLNCATVTPDIHRKLAAEAAKRGAASLEACMASSIPQARNGELYLMIGGDKAAFDAVEPLLRDLSSQLLYIGEAGRAAEVKALVNMVMNMNTAALAEGLGLGKALGLDLETLAKVFSQTGARSRVLETDGEDMIARDHECYFSAAHAAKDSGIALALARQASLELPMAESAYEQYRRMVEAGLGELDKSGVAELTFPDRRPRRPQSS